MRVRTKLITLALFVAVVPLAMAATQSIRLQESALDDALIQLHAAAARLGAQILEQDLEHYRSTLKSTVQESIAWENLSEEERQAALWLLLGQLPSSAIATYSKSGTRPERAYTAMPDASTRVVFAAADTAAFDRVTPPADANVAVGAAILVGHAPILPLSVSDRSGEQDPFQVALGVDLTPLCIALGKAKPKLGSVLLVDAWNRQVCADGQSAGLSSVSPSLLDALNSHTAVYSRGTDAGPVQGALATSADGFRVLVEQPMSVVSAPTRELRWRLLLWLAVGATGAVASGLLLGRDIVQPLGSLSAAARGIGEGRLDTRVDIEQRDDEFSELAAAFNQMADGIRERDTAISDWNRDLQARVEERSQQLADAERALLRSEKLAGLAVTTAGVAHEMNNPLTGVLGLAQLLTARLRKRQTNPDELPLLDSIVAESKRMQTLVKRMETLGAEHDLGKFRPVPLCTLLDSVLVTFREQFGTHHIAVNKDYEFRGEALGDSYQLHTAFAELLSNASKAVCSLGNDNARQITVAVTQPDSSWLEVVVSDNGVGIRAEHTERAFEPFFTTKLGGKGEGLGLAQVYRIVSAHSGNVALRVRPEGGTDAVMRLPIAKKGALLA